MEKLSRSERKKEDWLNSKWRPTMGWMYMAVCLADFIIFPILWSIIQAVGQGQVSLQWQPITLQGAGLFHVAMGAVLGVAAYGRTREKLGGVNNTYYFDEDREDYSYTPPESYSRSSPVTQGYYGKKAPISEPDELL